MNRREQLTWAQLVAMEPRLLAVADEARRRRAMRRGGDDAWYGYNRWQGDGLKARMSRLVGYRRRADEWKIPYNGPSTPFLSGRLISGSDLCAWREGPEGQRQARRRSAVRAEDEATGRGVLWSSTAYEVAYGYLLHLCFACRRKCCRAAAA